MSNLNIEVHMSFDVVDAGTLDIRTLKEVITTALVHGNPDRSLVGELAKKGYDKSSDMDLDIVIRSSEKGA